VKYFVGIDFGTSNSSIAYVVDPEDGKEVTLEARVVPFQKDDGSEDTRLPSLGRGSGSADRGRRGSGSALHNTLYGEAGAISQERADWGRGRIGANPQKIKFVLPCQAQGHPVE
jgi:molecular chaperone DnaK (HSP70)